MYNNTNRDYLDYPIVTSLSGQIRYENKYEVISKVVKSIKDKRVCQVEHTTGSESIVAYTHLVVKDKALYAQGYFVTNTPKPEIVSTVSHYVHRMKDVTIIKYKHNFKPETNQNLGIMQDGAIKAEIHFKGYAVDYIKDRIYSDDQVITELDDKTIILTLTVNNKYELMSFVQGFGSDACLISPEDIRQEIKDDLATCLNQYQ